MQQLKVLLRKFMILLFLPMAYWWTKSAIYNSNANIPALDNYKDYFRSYLKKRPLLSIVVIVLNNAKGLRKTLESIVCQTETGYEIVVVDGGSNDGTVEVIKEFKDKIAWWISEPDRGISDAFNKGVAASNGKFINFLNSDDIYSSVDTLAKVFPLFQDDVIVSGYARAGLYYLIPQMKLSNDTLLIDRAMLSHQASFIPKSIFENKGLHNLRLRIRMDYEYWLRILPFYRFDFINEILVESSMGGVSTRNPELFMSEAIISLKCVSVRKFNVMWRIAKELYIFNNLRFKQILRRLIRKLKDVRILLIKEFIR